MTWRLFLLFTIPGFVAWFKTGSISIGLITFVLQMIIAPFFTATIIRWFVGKTFLSYQKFYVVMSNLIVGGMIFNIIYFIFMK